MTTGMDARTTTKARYIMIGGFLGAGKSTALGRLARRLTDRGNRVGLITNDQGTGLVDTAALRSQGFDVEEIAGGCFCCRFNSLREAASRLTAESRPDVFLAEPVGSCTDLVATVSYPLRRIYGDEFVVAPLSVLVDPARAARVLGIESGRRFSPKVTYVYEKQLEEADLIVINKCDLLDDDRRRTLRDALATRYPAAEVLEVSARAGAGLDEWFERLATEEMAAGRPLDIDYDVYAEGEALLGWLNGTIELASDRDVDAGPLLAEFAGAIQGRLQEADAEVAHLKMTLSPAGGINEIALVSLVRGDFVPELGQELDEPVRRAQIIVNLRAEADPDLLRRVVTEEAARFGERKSLAFDVDHVESFRPGRPVPTHRMTT